MKVSTRRFRGAQSGARPRLGPLLLLVATAAAAWSIAPCRAEPASFLLIDASAPVRAEVLNRPEGAGPAEVHLEYEIAPSSPGHYTAWVAGIPTMSGHGRPFAWAIDDDEYQIALTYARGPCDGQGQSWARLEKVRLTEEPQVLHVRAVRNVQSGGQPVLENRAYLFTQDDAYVPLPLSTLDPSDVPAETRDAATSSLDVRFTFGPRVPGHLFHEGQELEVEMLLARRMEKVASEQRLRVEYSLDGAGGHRHAFGQWDPSFSAGDLCTRLPWRFTSLPKGLYLLSARVYEKQDLLLEQRTRCAVLPEARRHSTKFFGIAVDECPRPDLLGIMASAGVRTLRLPFHWFEVDAVSAPFHWAKLETIVSLAEEHRLQLLPVLSPFIVSAADRTVSAVSDARWCRFVVELFKRYGGRIKQWELFGQRQPGYFSPATYRRFLSTTVRLADLVGATCRFGAYQTHHDLYQVGFAKYMNAWVVHPQVLDVPEPLFEAHLQTRAAKARLRAHETWVTGHSSALSDEVQHLSYMVRAHVRALAAGADVFCWRDASGARNERPNLGPALARPDGSPNLALLAYDTLTRLLAGTEFVSHMRLGLPETQAYLFADPKRPYTAAAVWASDGQERKLTLRRAEEIEAFDLLYQPLGRRDDDQLEVRISAQPVFLTGQSLPASVLASVPASPGSLGEVRLLTEHLRPTEEKQELRVRVRNFADETIDVRLEVELPPDWGLGEASREFRISSHRSKVVSYSVRTPTDRLGGRFQYEPVRIAAELGAGSPARLEFDSQLAIRPFYERDLLPITVAPTATGADGRVVLTAKITNKSAEPDEGTLLLESPNWRPDSREPIAFGPLAPAESALLSFPGQIFGAWHRSRLALVTEDRRRQTTRRTQEVDLLSAREALQPPVIDADLEEWESVKPIVLDRYAQLARHPASWWVGPQTLSGKVYAQWDQDYLYLAGKVVTDADLSVRSGDRPVAKRPGSVVFALAPSWDTGRSHRTWSFAVAPGPILRKSRGPGLDFNETHFPTRAASAHDPDGGHLRYELAVPWEAFPSVHPTPYLTLAFGCRINKVLDDGQLGSVEWHGGVGASRDPALLGTLTLIGSGRELCRDLPVDPAAFAIRIEGEATVADSFTVVEKNEAALDGQVLSLDRDGPDDYFAMYNFTVPRAGYYELWAASSPLDRTTLCSLSWRIDSGGFRTSRGFHHVARYAEDLGWTRLGRVRLRKGQHTLTVRADKSTVEKFRLKLDAFGLKRVGASEPSSL